MAEQSQENLKDKLEAIVTGNTALETELINKYKVSVNPWMVVQMRLNMLLDYLLEDVDRFGFEIESAQHIRSMLEQIKVEKEKQGITQQLLLPTKRPLTLP